MLAGYRVAQVRSIFKIMCRNTDHPLHNKPLAYVQWFSPPDTVAEAEIKMYLVQRSRSRLTSARLGSVISHASISRFVQLIPYFGSNIDRTLTADNSMEKAKLFWVNSFADKEIYKAVY
jgi:hypothetical protein